MKPATSSFTLNIEGMTCAHCVMTVEGALRNVNLNGKVNLKTGSVTIDAEDTEQNLNEAKKAIDATGYQVL